MDTQLVDIPTHIAFRHTDRSAALEERARELVAKLDRFHDRITNCRIMIEAPSSRHLHGSAFAVSFEIMIPGGVIYATSGNAPHPEHADPYLALRDAFENAKRQLQDFARSE